MRTFHDVCVHPRNAAHAYMSCSKTNCTAISASQTIAGTLYRKTGSKVSARYDLCMHFSRLAPGQDYHFAPCVASISLWSGKLLESPAFTVKAKPTPAVDPPKSPSKQDQAPPSEEEETPKKKEVEDKYSTTGGCRLILGSKEGVVRIFESSTRVNMLHQAVVEA